MVYQDIELKLFADAPFVAGRPFLLLPSDAWHGEST